MRKRLKWLIPGLAVLLLIAAFLIYVGIFYRADETALAALASDETVRISRTEYGWLFDGPSETDAMIFYPGAKVEAEAYAPLLRLLAGEGMDVLLVEMPFRLAVFGSDRAEELFPQYEYADWYIGGHSLGGAVAANYAAAHVDRLRGLILFAAYPSKPLDDSLVVVSVYGSEDGVLNMDKLAAGRAFVPGPYYEYAIDGGNHGQFGSYGVQSGDGTARISAEEQRQLAADFIFAHIPGRRQ